MASSAARIATRVNADGATVYMTRAALEELVAELTQLIQADPVECREVHMNMHFSRWEGDVRIRPSVSISEELQAVVVDARQAHIEQDIATGELPQGTWLEPFEITLMHVSPEAVAEESSRGQ